MQLVETGTGARGKMLRFPLKKALSAAIAGVAALAAGTCIFNSEKPPEPLLLQRVDSSSDTISVFPRLVFSLSSRLTDDTVSLEFSPPFYDFYAFVNQSRDTLTLVVTGELQGDSRYVLRPSVALVSVIDEEYEPGRDSMVLFTVGKEKEPNNTPADADAFISRICGTISQMSDTDWYRMEEIPGRTLRLRSLDSRLGMALRGPIDGPSVAVTTISGTMAIPDTLEPPLFVSVYTYVRDAGSRYELSIVK
jgi:hypothetical protein